jgi:hypothetical protein
MITGNKGEWSELYIFFKILTDKRIYTADANLNKIKDVFLNVITIIREEVKNYVYKYNTGENVIIKLNGKEVGRIPNEEFIHYMNIIWDQLKNNKDTTFSNEVVEDFLNRIHVTKLKSPSTHVTNYFGGTVDIVLETEDRSGVVRILGFSCKSDIKSPSTLLNASQDNTNFVYELEGPVNDEVMNHFNNIFKVTQRRGEVCKDIATHERIDYLKELGIDLKFVKTALPIANENLIMSGGMEMPKIIAGMLKLFYFVNSGSRTFINDCIKYLSENDIAGYGFPNLEDVYYSKVASFLYNTFTGLRLGTLWNGKAEVNGGYIVVKKDGDVVAFHSTIADEFKDFLVSTSFLEGPSHKRHLDMVIEKEGDRYYLKFALQIRFALNR